MSSHPDRWAASPQNQRHPPIGPMIHPHDHRHKPPTSAHVSPRLFRFLSSIADSSSASRPEKCRTTPQNSKPAPEYPRSDPQSTTASNTHRSSDAPANP